MSYCNQKHDVYLKSYVIFKENIEVHVFYKPYMKATAFFGYDINLINPVMDEN